MLIPIPNADDISGCRSQLDTMKLFLAIGVESIVSSVALCAMIVTIFTWPIRDYTVFFEIHSHCCRICGSYSNSTDFMLFNITCSDIADCDMSCLNIFYMISTCENSDSQTLKWNRTGGAYEFVSVSLPVHVEIKLGIASSSTKICVCNLAKYVCMACYKPYLQHNRSSVSHCHHTVFHCI